MTVNLLAGERADYQGPDYEGWDRYVAPCMAFVEKHIDRK